MKKILISLTAIILSGCQNSNQMEFVPQAIYIDDYVINKNSVPIYEKKAVMTTDAARNFSVELPKRCTVDWNNQQIVSVVPEQPMSLVRVDKGDALPRFEVKNFSFKNENLKVALERLLDGTDITVASDSSINSSISGDIQAGDLTDALDLMVRLGQVYYSYDSEHKLLKLSLTAKWVLNMPKDDMIVLALIDAMRGASMRNMLVNWEEKTIVFSGNSVVERNAQKIISSLGSKKYMIAYDIDVYRLYPKVDKSISWIDVLPAFGSRNIKMSIPGTVGRLLVTSSEVNTKTLQEFVSSKANAVLISQGTFALPNNWQSKFEIGQCSREDRLETDLSVVVQSKYGNYAGSKQNKFETKMVLRTINGELASFDVPSNLGDNFVIIGIPTHAFVDTNLTTISPYAELAMFISPRLISIQSVDELKSLEGLSGEELRNFLNIDVEVDSKLEPVSTDEENVDNKED